MNDNFNKIIESIRSINLSADESKRIWHNVDAYVANNPTEETPVIRRTKNVGFSPFFFHTQRVALFSLVAVIMLGGGTSIAAQDALPNNALYNIKVNVNEEVRSWFVFGAESKAYYETKRAGERLDEAQKLAIVGKLDTESKEKIQTNLKKHTNTVQKQIATIEAKNDLGVALSVSKNFETSLKEHSDSLKKIEQELKSESKKVVVEKDVNTAIDGSAVTATLMSVEDVDAVVVDDNDNSNSVLENEEEQSEISQIVDSIQENINLSVQLRQEVESKIPLLSDDNTKKTIAENKKTEAVNQIEKVRSVINQNRNIVDVDFVKVSVASTTMASTTLDKAIMFVFEGESKFKVKEYGDAFVSFKNGFDIAVIAEDVLATSTVQIKSTTTPIKSSI
jgi:hypothetical protein